MYMMTCRNYSLGPTEGCQVPARPATRPPKRHVAGPEGTKTDPKEPTETPAVTSKDQEMFRETARMAPNRPQQGALRTHTLYRKVGETKPGSRFSCLGFTTQAARQLRPHRALKKTPGSGRTPWRLPNGHPRSTNSRPQAANSRHRHKQKQPDVV